MSGIISDQERRREVLRKRFVVNRVRISEGIERFLSQKSGISRLQGIQSRDLVAELYRRVLRRLRLRRQ